MADRTSKWAWVRYTLVRVGLFAALLVLFVVVLPIEPWISAVIAAIVSLCVSYIFLAEPRAAMSRQLAEARSGSRRSPTVRDDDAEDAAVEGESRQP